MQYVRWAHIQGISLSVLSNARWIALAQAVKIGAQLVNMVVLTRLIGPNDYGLMALAGIATNLALLLRDMGTSAAIIQKAEVSQQMASSVFWLNLGMGTVLCGFTMLLAPLMANVFGTPQLVEVLVWLAITFPLSSSASAHQSTLERHSRFKTVALIESVASALSLAVALYLAYQGWGVFSLVSQAVVSAALSAALLWWASGWRPSLSFELAELKAIMGFSGNMAGYQLTSYLFRNADAFLVGKLVGVGALGFYALAYKVMLFPVQNISWVATRAAFPVMSRMQGDLPQLAALFLRLLSVLSFIVGPLMFGLLATAQPFTLAVFGGKWADMAGILSWLSVVGYVQVITGTTGPVLMALGRSGDLFKLAIFGSGLHLLLFGLGALWQGSTGVAAGYLVASLVVSPVTFWLTCRRLGIRLGQVWGAVWPSLVCAVVMAAVVWFVRAEVEKARSAEMVLWACGAAGLLTYVAASFLWQRSQFTQVSELIRLKKGQPV
ncbi:MOP flippase family protein [Aquabacterium sp.]|uniref:MOP flippase family protein n=1 Tax=Aquabacterium sp. TaxID=1872578 RepID=UPI0025BF5B79|nr:MOP flippase family protein [Aquabacterium sp.]